MDVRGSANTGQPGPDVMDRYRFLIDRTAGFVGPDFLTSVVGALQDLPEIRFAALAGEQRVVAAAPSDCVPGIPAAVFEMLGSAPHVALTGSTASRALPEAFHGTEQSPVAVVRVPDAPQPTALVFACQGTDSIPEDILAAAEVLAARSGAELRREAAEAARALSEAKFATAFRAAPSMIAISEFDTGVFTDASNAFAEVLGYRPDEMIGRTAHDLGHWEYPQEREALVEELKRTGELKNREIHLLTRQGQRRIGLLSAEIINMTGRAYILSAVQDVTDYQSALQALQEREVSYRMLFNASNDMVFVYHLDDTGMPGRFVEVNNVACERLGYTREELLGLTPLDVIGPGGMSSSPTPGQRLLDNPTVLFETSVLTREGHEIPVESNAHRFEHHGRRAVMSVVRDIRERKRKDRALREAERKYRQIFENSLEGIYQTTPDGRIISANPALARLLGFESAESLLAESGTPIATHAYIKPGLRHRLIEKLERHGQYSDEEFEIVRSDGTVIWVRDNARAVRDVEGHLLYYEGALQNITARKEAEERLSQSEQKYRTLVDTSQDGVFIACEGRFAYVNRAFAQMLGYRQDQLTDAPVDRVRVSEDPERETVSPFGTDAPEHCECRLLHRNRKSSSIVSINVGRIRYRGKHAVAGTVRDITEQKAAEAQLVHNALHDELTGLPNRNLFLDRLQQAMQRASRRGGLSYAVVFLDLDRFKLINDSLGHAVGDRLLIRITERLRQCVRPADLIARHGGDEFTILLEDLDDPAEAERVAVRIHEELARPAVVDGHELFTNASIGIAVNTPHYTDPDELLRDADTAMYRAKAAGRGNYVVFDDEMHRRARAHLRLETDLRRALDQAQFEIRYQPVFSLDDRRVTGFEALLRWNHPRRGLLSPDAFLDIAEETGLIIPIGWWALARACYEMAEWVHTIPEAKDLTVSVNIANRQFSHWKLAGNIAEVLDECGLAPHQLCLEITETVFMEDPEAAKEVLTALRDLGIQLQMDDFGTGYSSLSGLRNFQLDTLKIDRSFVKDIESDEGDLAIVRTIAALARDLRMDIVAEGVETARQADILRGMGCHKGQGFHFAYPLTSEDTQRFIRNLAAT